MRHDLAARLDRLEDQLISPLARRIEQLSSADRAAYERWKAERVRWSRQFAPGMQFEAWLNGDDGPQLSRRIAMALASDQPSLTTNATVADAAEAWSRCKERNR